jgi:hypothetical protein
MALLSALRPVPAIVGLALLANASAAGAESPASDGVTVSIHSPRPANSYPILTRGSVVLVNAQRLVVTREPLPVASVTEAPPEPKTEELEADRPPPPSRGAIWVPGHWTYAASGFSWVAGRYVFARAGHVFVPPRWAVYEEQHLYFTGFYVPLGVYVRSHFNKYYYSGTPKQGSQSPHGPYWPVGAPTRGNSALTSANANDPYWPIGARR